MRSFQEFLSVIVEMLKGIGTIVLIVLAYHLLSFVVALLWAVLGLLLGGS